MNKRKLGNQGLTVSAEGLGCMGMTSFYGPVDKSEAIATIHRALDLGVTLLDTADAYGPFTNERLLAEALAGRARDSFVLASKAGFGFDDDGSWIGLNGSPSYLKRAVERSLKNLKVDVIDLYYLHRLDPNVPVEDSVGALGDLVSEGKIRFIGLCEVSPEIIRRAHAACPVSAIQSEYSVFERGVEADGVLDEVARLRIGFVAYAPLGRGLLSGEITKAGDLAADDARHQDERFQGENLARNLHLVSELRRLASARGVEASQLALAWVLHQGYVAIPGTKRRKYLEINARAASIELTAAELAAIEAAVPRGSVAGKRYAP